jgi:mannose/fructose-specific phosphotransferase system component IIA
LLETAAIISGQVEGVETVGLYPGGGAEDVEEALVKFASQADENDSILCLADIPGGSPSRVAAALSLTLPNFHVVAGVNLGMLTEALLLKDAMEIEELKKHIIEATKGTIIDVGEQLKEELSNN